VPRTAHPAQRHVAAVARALSVLDVLAEAGDELGTNEIARRTGINASTVSRILATLAESRLVEYVAESRRYRLGLRLVHLGNIVLDRLDLRQIARPHLQALVEATHETATLSAPGERIAVTLDFVQSPSSVQSVAEVGRPSVGHATATGKVMLAFTQAAPSFEPLETYTRRTITSRSALVTELERVRAQGWARSVGERELDLNAVAAPVWDSVDKLTAMIGVQGPASRFNVRAMRAALEPLQASAAAISRALGRQS
jgi:DNA-binding IclR family transcriptional regulator